MAKSTGDMEGKTAFITGGSGGLGKALAKAVARRGAHVTLFARRQGPLDEAKREVEGCRRSETQDINTVAIDLSDAKQVDAAFKSQPRVADLLYCTAGGNHAENGFLVDITADDLDSCMKNNYYTAAFPAKSIMDIWTADDAGKDSDVTVTTPPDAPKLRQIVFVSSAGAFLGIPGSIAYTPAKVAVRALADTLRMEALRYSCPKSTYSIHCAFPADFVSPGFYLEQKTKTDLSKRIQGLEGKTAEDLQGQFPSSDEMASLILGAVDKGDFIICNDSLGASLLFTNMVGPSPKRGLGILDALSGVLVGWLVWPVLRRRWESWCRDDGEQSRKASLTAS
ncbi:putative short chain dehydrogenase/ reductase [Astrocystis sublimbata]|nr:putative short chain dehydrogenase/ reductase [Astrocystis sublimbata]